jgi:hypothetical protein
LAGREFARTNKEAGAQKVKSRLSKVKAGGGGLTEQGNKTNCRPAFAATGMFIATDIQSVAV